MTRFTPLLRAELEDLYAEYAERLDDGPLETWPELFMEDCEYLVVPRDNYERGLPIAVMRCESRNMLKDRVRAVQETVLFEPRYLRHHVTNLRGGVRDDDTIEVRASFSVVEVLPDELPRVLMCGRYVDEVIRSREGALRFLAKHCVFDSVLVPNTIVVPV
ncbi:MAG: aromatic-ring-hydroxylating dioxygenase subunit beta [Gammaproteobacteria bacterium]|nr:aromatic-ring-hydroxylating dioxygenase subunit beta [Gammaproteobacteria bacterium]